jgi:hypothetical protein
MKFTATNYGGLAVIGHSTNAGLRSGSVCQYFKGVA